MKEELLFCPLGGSGEIGMNMNLFAYGKPGEQKWIIVDIGVTFADDTVPGVDLIYPDPGFIVDKKDDLLGIVLTHAHEDHIGAIAHIWPKLKCKIYATPFTAALINQKFIEKKIDITSYLKIVSLNGTVDLDPFKIEFVTLTHSILEPDGLKIETPAGNIFHTGDWKCDSNPLIGEKVNSKSVLSSRSNKKELIEIVENLIDLMPVELRTARWLVREQDTYLNKAREEANEILSIAKIESDRLIADSYVLQEAVIEANALIKKAEDEAQAYRAQIEDQIDAKLTEVLNKFEQINNFIETEKKSLRQPRKIVEPE